jgi:hypothetical protein
MRRAAFIPLALISAQALAMPPRLESGTVWHCPVAEALRCDPGRECSPAGTNFIILLDPAAGRYMICWNELGDCDSHAARFSTWGEYLTAQDPGSGTVVKLSTDLAVTEVSTIGHAVFIARGRCRAGPRPASTNAPRG